MSSTTDQRATLLLRAVNLASESEIRKLTNLVAANQELFQVELVLRILLTYLPESTDPSLYVNFLKDLVAGKLPVSDSLERDADAGSLAEQDPSAPRTLPLLKLPNLDKQGAKDADFLTKFLIAKAHKIDAETGSLTSAQGLIEPFISHSNYLRVWANSTILPLWRIEYELYPDQAQKYTLKAFEALRGRSGLYTILFDILRRNKAAASRDYARDFRQILGPWVLGEIWRICNSESGSKSTNKGTQATDGSSSEQEVATKLWRDVFEALLDHSTENPTSLVELAQNWDGPTDIDAGSFNANHASGSGPAPESYAQMLLASIYLPLDTGAGFTREQQSSLLRRVAASVQSDLHFDPSKPDFNYAADTVPYSLLESIETIHLDRGELMDPENPLTAPSVASVHLAALLAASTTVLESLGESMLLRGVASLAFFGGESDQKKRVQKILHALASRSSAGDGFWREMRQKMLWLRQWNTKATEAAPLHGIFSKVKEQEMEIEMLKTLTSAGRFKLLSDIYIKSKAQLPTNVVEKTLIEVALAAYDGADNGNKSRGDMKQASDIISTFRHQLPESDRFRELGYLVQATHALSFYKITLENGLPCLPGRVRSSRQPLALIERLLAQNSKSYTKLDDLIDVGRNLARAGLVQFSTGEAESDSQGSEELSSQITRQIIAKAVEAALAEDDFDTAYSYVVNRLSLSRSETKNNRSDSKGDPLWQAAYHAGRYRPNSRGGSSEMRRIEQRMELLSQAAQLGPPSSLLEILRSWRECEKELNDSISKETAEEEDWNYQADRTIPGGFSVGDVVPASRKPRESTRGALSEDAPMGLFDVARGAAAAFSKSAFPLAGQAGRGAPLRSEHMEESGQGGRVRKRDMVSSAVAGGLASGIGWVIGANPAAQE